MTNPITDAAGPEIAAPGVTRDDVDLFKWIAARRAHPFETTVVGNSMGAVIPDGSRIRILSPGEAVFRRHQIVAFLAGRQVMVHRIVRLGRGKKAGDHLITQGDGNWVCDPPIRCDAVLGVVEECMIAGQWRTVGQREVPHVKRLVAGSFLLLFSFLLEWHPGLAMAAARMVSMARMKLRRIAHILGIRGTAHVRN